ncbi:ATP-binding cassette domain-containing protein [Thermosipho ferrireducens]|uniref:ATP-binding cassette domain-containing protein n=1 Tax=Thermosipho ferrireducens TaxID=2571116 RepID=A0ABX7S7Q7_9BACT|nr:ATP-binding cassette domain-containing protein [Thermosipho ferrireducens]QTA38622.1 ATP-binding cassette domain-containing protein [Thermosipho ferrireducens]
MLRIESLKKSFNGKFVLTDVNFTIKRGEILALVGPNGAGKTTTINCITGVFPKDGGKIYFEDEEFTEIHKEKIAVVPEDRVVFPKLNGKDYYKLWSTLYSSWNEKVFERFIAKYNFNLSQRIETYSIGMKTLFLVGLAVSSGAEILLLDEPTQHLDPTIRIEIMKIIRDYAETGKSVLVSSHEIFELEEYADNIAIIKEGRVIFTDSIDHAKETHKILSSGEELTDGTIIGLVKNELLVKTDIEIGRYPKLSEIVIGYLTGKQSSNIFE